MTIYTSIRIYISSSASILPNGFYNVVGFLGASVGSSTNPYHIDKDFNFPVVRANGQYYYLTYNVTDGFRPSMLDAEQLDSLFVPTLPQRPIYLEERDDAHLISSYESPLAANFVIDNLDSLYTAYREVTVTVYDDYAIEEYGSIHDRNNIIDVVDADFVLAQTNPDRVQILPAEGIVQRLYSFELTYPYPIAEANIDYLRKIALYDYNSNNIATGIDVNSISYTIGSPTVTFSLLATIEAPSLYFLYIPTGTFTYANQTNQKSKMAMFAYTIKGTQGGGSIYEFYYSPTSTKRLREIKLTFFNLLNVTGVSYINTLELEGPNGTEQIECNGTTIHTSGNEVIVTLPNEYTNDTNDAVTYTLTIPAYTILLQADSTWLANDINLPISVIGETAELPTNGDYSFSVAPQPGQVYELSYLNIFIKFPEDVSGQVTISPEHTYSEIVLGETSEEFEELDHISNVQAKNPYLDENGLQTYEFDCRFSRKHSELEAYTIKIPEELFAITIFDGESSETIYNIAHSLNYTIIPKPASDEGDTGHISFDYKLLTFMGESTTPSADLAFRPGTTDTILVNRPNLLRILTSPCLTVTYLDHANGEAIIGKEILALEPGDVMTVNIRATYYNEENIEVSTTSSVDYGFLAGAVTNYDLSTVFPVFRNGYPNYFRLTFIFNYNQTEIQKEIEVQVLPSYIFYNVKNNINWTRTTRFDLYSGTETTKQWGCMFLTNQYDCVLNYTVPGETEEDPRITKYIAELVPTTKVRTGNLSGIYNDTFGANQPQGYGLYGENVYLTGNFYLNNGKSLIDISDDILLATGNVKEVQDRLQNLNTSVRATIEALTLRQESFENGLDANIKNYISTNKNAVLKIGLDYSIWALGSAGISMVNPNASYKFDPVSGNYTVDADTVGDGDEYISLQGNKIAINTYKTKYFKAPEPENPGDEPAYQSGFYMEIVFTTINPTAWEYDANGSIYVPHSSNEIVGFSRGYINALPATFNSVPMTEESTNILHFANLLADDLNESGFARVANSITPIISYVTASPIVTNNDESINETYSFNSYYQDNKLTAIVYIADDNDNLIPWTEASTANAIYYVPRVEQAGLFKNGKFNSKYIEAENLIAVDVSSSEVGEGNERHYLYEKNQQFDPTKEISKDDNYPVYLAGTDTPAEQANFVVVSGSTGKITARGADIRGTIIVGDENQEHIKITDNKGSDAELLNSGPGLYIKKDKNTILAQFGAGSKDNPLDWLQQSSLYTAGEGFGTKSLNVAVTPDEIYGPYPISSYTNYDEWGNPTSEPMYEIQASYSGSNNTIFSTSGSFVITKNSQKILKIRAGELKLTASGYGGSVNSTVSATVYFGVINTTTNAFTTLYTYNSSNFYAKTIYLNNAVAQTLTNDTDVDETYNFAIKLYGSVHGMYTTTYSESQLHDTSDPEDIIPESYTCTFSLQLTNNINYTVGTAGHMTRVFGNGLLVGYDAENYFTTYFTTDSTNKMILDFQSEGYGMKYSGGNVYNYIKHKEVKAYIPILQGKIDKVNNVPCFIGTSVFNDGRAYTAERYLRDCQYVPYFSDALENHFWWWKDDVDDRGKAVNMNLPRAASPDDRVWTSSCFHDTVHNLYITCGDGMTVIMFGPEWDELFGIGFIGDSLGILSEQGTPSKLRTVVQVSGIGRYTDQTDRTIPTSGPLFATVSAVIGKQGLQNSNASFKYNGSSVTISNMIQVLTADDATTNPGAFFITVYYCPN